jgi:hypothetical protein
MNAVTRALFEFLLVPAMTGLFVGLVTSWLWWRYLLSRGPDVRISSCVLKGTKPTNSDQATERGKTVHRIKLINCGERQVIDLKAKAEILEHRGNRWGLVKELKLEFDGAFPALGKQSDYGNVTKAISPVHYSLIENENDIRAELNADRRLVFTLSAKDALSGTTEVQRKFYTAKEIQEGDFESGFTFEKVELPS